MPTATDKNLLAIGYHFPMGSVASFRNREIVRHLLPSFTDIHVITRRYNVSSDAPLLPFPTYAVPHFDYRYLLALLHGSPESSKAALSKKGTTKTSRAVRKILDSFPTTVLIGEGGLAYIVLAYLKAVKLVRKYRITHLFSFYRSHSDHVIAYLLKRKFPGLYWIADFADFPIDASTGNVYWPQLQLKINRHLLQRADAVTTVSHGLVKHLKNYHDNVHLLRNGISEIEPIGPEEASPFTIAYTGSVYGFRHPGLLLKAVRALLQDGLVPFGKIRILYAGKDGAQWDQWVAEHELTEIAVNRGLVSHREAQTIQQRSHLNLLLTWSGPQTEGWLTYKVYEYLRAGKPVLALVAGTPDRELNDLLAEQGNGLALIDRPENLEAVKGFVRGLYDQWDSSGTVPRSESDQWKKYTWDRIIARFVREVIR